MQVTNTPNPPPPTASPAARPVPQVEPVEAAPRDKPANKAPANNAPANNAPANKALERAIVEAAGVKPADSGTVRVALSVDGNSNRVVAKVFNKDTGELVRQIPADQILSTAAFDREFLGAAVNKLA